MIRLSDVQKTFDHPVLRGIDLAIPKGSLYGLIGPGASGKSLLLKIIAGLVRPDSGTVSAFGEDVLAMNEGLLAEYRKGIGMLFQNNALFDFMTVAENVAFPLRRLFDFRNEEVLERVSERLSRVGLPGFESRMPSGLSGGQKKRVGIARATVTHAQLLLYDEPAAGLDPVSSRRIFDLLRQEQRQSGATVVMVSSDLPRFLPITDRIGMLLDGRLVFDGTHEAAQTCDDARVRQFVTGDPEGPL